MHKYKYDIEGGEYIKGKVQKIGKVIAVSVPHDWLGSAVLVIREGDIKRFEKIEKAE